MTKLTNPRNILVVEDSPTQAFALSVSLRKGGFEVKTAASLVEALSCLDNAGSDVVLLDLSLPDSSGIDTFYQLHKHCPDVPIVVLTGLDDASIGLETLMAGAQDYLVKGQPSDESLIRCLRYAIERHRIQSKLKAREMQIRQLNEELERRVEERTAELERSNFELHQFAKIASHDLQEPLRAIQGYASLLARRYKGRLDKDADDFINFMLEGTKRMSQLIEDVLAHSRIRTTEHSADITDCKTAIQESLANLELTILESGAEISIGELPKVQAERTQMIQLFQNLIANAIKFQGSASPRIDISVMRNEKSWLFSVKDNGIGIDSKHAKRIFDMFSRLHSRTDYPGTGMGLAICKKIVESHHGNIWVESQPESGSTFFFTLPVDGTN